MKIYKRLLLMLSGFLCIASLFAQKTIVTGTVTDNKNQPVPGVTVSVGGKSTATVTDDKGHFSISVDNKATDRLLFTHISYKRAEVPVAGKGDVSIVLEATTSTITDVVVVGYGTQKKTNLSGAVNTINPKELTDKPVTSLTNALQGTVPGMTILGRPGDVGSDIGTINVRGRGNLGTSAPLFVVDGIPVDANVFARLSPADVASISVLKDAASSAIYGSRAAYGVILVTTKKGNAGSTQVQYNGSYGLQSPTVLPAMLDANGYAMLRNEAETNAGRSPIYSATQLATIKNQTDPDHFPNTDWMGAVFRKSAPLTDHQLSVSGGNDKTRYYLSGTYMDQASLRAGKGLQRYSVISNIDARVSKIFRVGTNINYTRDEYKSTTGDYSMVQVMRMIPLMVEQQSDGNWGTFAGGMLNTTLAKDNPVRLSEIGGRSNYFQNRLLGTITGTLTPIEGLNIDGTVSYRLYNNVNSAFVNTMPNLVNFDTKQPIANSGQTVNSLTENRNYSGNLLTQLTATYEKHYGDHYGKLLAGTSFEKYSEDNIQDIRKNFPNNNMNAINGGSTVPADNSMTGTKYAKAFQSFFGRFNYNFKEKYFFEANMRIDASSQFAPGHRTGYFPSFSGAWRISEERFMKNVSWVQQLKLRGSWGVLGNVNNVGYYDFYDGLSSGSALILDETPVSGVWPHKVYNPDLSWEVKTMTNIGLDGALFNNRLNFQIDAYHSVTSKILLPDPNVPDEAGLAITTDPNTTEVPSRNLGKVQNNGIELTLGYNGKIGKDFTYTIGGNFSKVWNKILELDGVSDSYTTGTYYIMKKGEAIGSFYMWQAQGLFANDADAQKYPHLSGNKGGDIRYVDQDHNGTIDGNDRTIVGNDVPYFTYGVNLGAAYKGFDLAVNGQGVANVKVYLDDEASQPFFNGAGVRQFHLSRWTQSNPDPNAAFPRMLISSDNTNNLKQSSFWLFNADYFRIKTISLGYTLPQEWLRKMKIQRLRFYVAANNYFTIRGDHRLKDFDPEAPSSRASFPQLKTASFGVNLTF